VFGREAELGDEVVVVGGGQVGCETALHLARLGKAVTLLEMQPELAPDASVTYRATLLHEMKKVSANLEVILDACCTAIAADGVTYQMSSAPQSGEDKPGAPQGGDGTSGAGQAGGHQAGAGPTGQERSSDTAYLAADTVIVAVGMKPLAELADGFRGAAEDYRQAGDCIRPRNVEHAVREGFIAATSL